MNTSQLRRITMATSALVAALTLLSVAHVPTANAMMLPRDPDPGTNSAGTWLPIDEVVTIRKTAAAQYYVDHASELIRN